MSASLVGLEAKAQGLVAREVLRQAGDFGDELAHALGAARPAWIRKAAVGVVHLPFGGAGLNSVIFECSFLL